MTLHLQYLRLPDECSKPQIVILVSWVGGGGGGGPNDSELTAQFCHTSSLRASAGLDFTALSCHQTSPQCILWLSQENKSRRVGPERDGSH